VDADAAAHPTDPILHAYAQCRLAGASAASVDSHLSSCAKCRNRVAEMSSDSFLGRLREVHARPGSSRPVGSSIPGMSTTGGQARSSVPPRSSALPSGLSNHADYEILGELGRGGMGVVYLAQNKLMGRKEVLKVVSRELIDRRGVLDRFLREIRNAAQLHHANIVTAYSAIRAGESIVFAMEYVEGYDLGQLVKGQGPLPVALACNFIYQVAQGLQYAHEIGMVHRDIKPSNLILAREGTRPVVKVLDFGLAKATREGHVDAGLTHEGQMLGTPDYIAPEQSLDAQRADIAPTSTAWAARSISCCRAVRRFEDRACTRFCKRTIRLTPSP
jgi:serine/threonine protein kinase